MSFFKGIANKIGQGVATANIKSQQMMNVSRLNLAIKGKEDDVGRLQNRLGIAVYESWDTIKKGSSTPEIDEIIQGIRDLNREIIALKRERMDVQGKMECPGCGKVIAKDDPACSSCGKELTVRDLLAKSEPGETTIGSTSEQVEVPEPGSDVAKDTGSSADLPSQQGATDQVSKPTESKPIANKPTMSDSSSTTEARAEAKMDDSHEVLDGDQDNKKNQLPKGQRSVVKADLAKPEPPSREEKKAVQEQPQQETPPIKLDDSEEEGLPLGGSPIFLCFQCGHQVEEDKSTCSHCGTSL